MSLAKGENAMCKFKIIANVIMILYVFYDG